MTLTVRLHDRLETALEQYCAERGVTKSLVVHESLAAYLLGALPADDASAAARASSPFLRAFVDAGLLGAVAVGSGADKAAVRRKVAERVTQHGVGRRTRLGRT